MIKPTVSIKKSGPGTRELAAALNKLKRSEVLVGIPADHTARKDEPINNASLLFIHSRGSQLQNIPPRPVLEPAIEANKNLIAPELGQAAQAVFEQRPEEAREHLERAGTLGANAAKRWFDDARNNWAPNAPSTIAAKGSDKPLIDTGQLRRAITSVVREQ